MTFRPIHDNCLIILEPEPETTASGLAMVRVNNGPKARKARTARVIASGPGYFGRSSYLHPEGVFHPNELKPGDRIIVDALAGNNWDLDVSAPRNNGVDTSVPFFDARRLLGDKAEARVIREAEALAVINDETALAAE